MIDDTKKYFSNIRKITTSSFAVVFCTYPSAGYRHFLRRNNALNYKCLRLFHIFSSDSWWLFCLWAMSNVNWAIQNSWVQIYKKIKNSFKTTHMRRWVPLLSRIRISSLTVLSCQTDKRVFSLVKQTIRIFDWSIRIVDCISLTLELFSENKKKSLNIIFERLTYSNIRKINLPNDNDLNGLALITVLIRW